MISNYIWIISKLNLFYQLKFYNINIQYLEYAEGRVHKDGEINQTHH